MTRQTYTATATREEGWWTLVVEGVQGGYTQARRLDQAEAMVRDALATVLDVAEDSFDVDVEVHLADAPWATPLQEARHARSELEATQARARETLDRAIEGMHSEGLSVRDIGRLLGISYQYAAKVLAEARVTA